MPTTFEPDQMTHLSADIDQQLKALRAGGDGLVKGALPDEPLPPQAAPRQWQAIAAVVGEDPEGFWQRFKRVARTDLCEPDGVLYRQWQKWGDLDNKAVLKSFGAILVALGFSCGALQILVVSLAVIVIHLGVKTVCDEQGPSQQGD